MKIEKGKYYRTQDGDVVGPMRRTKDQSWYSCFHTWNEDGGIFLSGAEHGLDLISEVWVYDTPPSDEPAAQPTDGTCKFENCSVGTYAPAPEAKTLLDEFATAALKAMLTRHAGFSLTMARNAYEYADAMMEARKK
jgi:hypothetical protein